MAKVSKKRTAAKKPAAKKKVATKKRVAVTEKRVAPASPAKSTAFDRRYDVTIYTDGSCLGDRSGGWAAIILTGPDKVGKTVSGSAADTTNGRMELQAAIEGIKAAKLMGAKRILMRADATYVVNTINTWLTAWVKSNWMGATGTQVQNRDVLEELHAALDGVTVTVRHVKAHNGDKYNEMADKAAQKKSAAQSRKPVTVPLISSQAKQPRDMSPPKSRVATVLSMFR